jgi:hypothetical protein
MAVVGALALWAMDDVHVKGVRGWSGSARPILTLQIIRDWMDRGPDMVVMRWYMYMYISYHPR